MLQKLREAELEAETEHQRRLKVSRLTTNRQLPGSLGFAQLSLGLRRWRVIGHARKNYVGKTQSCMV